MSIAEKFEVIADEVYEKGKDYIWEVVQRGGKRKNYGYFAYMWDIDYIRPKYKVVPTDVASGNQTFCQCKFKKAEAKYFDFSQKPYGTASTNGWYYTFSTCTNLEEIEDIGMQAMINYLYCFAWCDKLHTIAILRSNADTSWGNAFTSCSALKNVTFEGVIAKSINLKDSAKLSGASIVSVFEALSTTASGQTITLSQTAVDNMAFPIVGNKGTYNSWTDLEQSRTNWTISLV